MTIRTKFVSGAVVADSSLNERQIRVIANSGKSDRVGDVLVARGAKLDNYRANNIVLLQHDPKQPIGNFEPEIKNDRVEGVLTFAPAGVSAKADEYCALYKAGVLKTVSVGFKPIASTPIKGGGELYHEWELMELSCVTIPCDAGAVVIGRSAIVKSGRVLNGANAALLAALQRRLDKGEKCTSKALGFIEKAQMHHAFAQDHAAAIAASAIGDDAPDVDDDDPDDPESDVELAALVGRLKRRGLVGGGSMREQRLAEALALASASDAGESHRRREAELLAFSAV
jgi:HK97 family phage prohead protease